MRGERGKLRKFQFVRGYERPFVRGERGKQQQFVRGYELGISTLFFLKILLNFVGKLSNFDKICKINFVLACTYSNGQHDPLPPTAEAAQRAHVRVTLYLPPCLIVGAPRPSCLLARLRAHIHVPRTPPCRVDCCVVLMRPPPFLSCEGGRVCAREAELQDRKGARA